MTIYYIPSREEMINADHIIRAKYEPPFFRAAGTDEDGVHFSDALIPPKLVLFLTELVLEDSCGYEGQVRGCASVSQAISLKGLEAEYLWDSLKRSAYALSLLPSEEEKIEMGVKE